MCLIIKYINLTLIMTKIFPPMIPFLGIFVRTANSEISDALLSLMLKPFMGICVNMRNTGNSEIRIVV